MATQAIKSLGALIKIGDGGGPESFTTVAEVMSLGAPEFNAKLVDVTSHDSAGGFDELIATVLSGGAVPMTLNFAPTIATQGYSSGILKDFVNRTKRNYKLVFPDNASTTWAFAALVQSFKIKLDVPNQITADISLRVTGQPTLV